MEKNFKLIKVRESIIKIFKMQNTSIINYLLFFVKVIFVFIYNLVCIAISLLPIILKNKDLYFLIVFAFTFIFTLNFFIKNKPLKIFNYALKFLFLLMAISLCFLIGRYAYFINKEIFLLLLIIFIIIYFYRTFFLKKIYPPLIFPAIYIFTSVVVFNFFYINRDLSKYKVILAQKYIKPILVFSKEYSKNCLYLVNAGSPRRILTDEKEKYLFVTFQDKPKNSYSVVSLNFKTISNLKVIFGESSRDPVIYKNKIFIPIHEKKQIIVIDINSFKVIKVIPIKYNYSMQILLNNKKNELLVTSEKRFLQVYNFNDFKFKEEFLPPINPYLTIINEKEQKMYVGAVGIMGAANGQYCIVEIDLTNFKITKALGKPWWVILGLDVDKKTNMLYAVDNLSGHLKIINIKNFKVIKEIYVGVGVREVAFDKKRNLLYVGNFITGDFYIIDAKNHKFITKIYLGDKIRGIYITPKTNKILVANVYGVFEIKIDKLIKNKFVKIY